MQKNRAELKASLIMQLLNGEDSVWMALYALVVLIVVSFLPAATDAWMRGLACSHTPGFDKDL